MADLGTSRPCPRFSVSIDGPSTFSLSRGSYPLTVTLRYHVSANASAITFNVFGTPVHQHAAFGKYLFYHVSQGKEGDATEVEPPMFELIDIPVEVCSENNFATVTPEPGHSEVRRELSLPAEIYSISIGDNYRLRLPSGAVRWWDYGPMESFKDVKVRPTQMRHDTSSEIIKISESNSIDVTVTE